LSQIQTDITHAVTVGVERINQITREIAQINVEIVVMEADNNVANDLRDRRNALVSELNEYLDIKCFEQSDHSLSIIAARGCTLVQGDSNYELVMEGDRVKWMDSGGSYVDITNYITKGKLCAWLDLRDNIIYKYKLDLDAMAKEFIWSVNQQHSQGVGLEGLSTVTGTYAVSNSGEALGTQDSGLDYCEKISDGNFNLWVYDSSGAVVGGSANVISIDSNAGGTTLSSLRNDINGVGNISASITTDGKLMIDADSGYTFAFSDDSSNVLAALGINTFFSGNTAGNISVNSTIVDDKNNIAAARIDAVTGEFSSGDNDNALAMTDLQYRTMEISQWTCNRINGNTEGSVTTTIEDYYHSMVGSIGIVSSSISRDTEFSEMMVNELNTLRNSISGVSLDEEMTNLIKYQHAYQAAAKLITISDEMLDTLISLR
jgi:flagellar hook-associated protein 1 FlgK